MIEEGSLWVTDTHQEAVVITRCRRYGYREYFIVYLFEEKEVFCMTERRFKRKFNKIL